MLILVLLVITVLLLAVAWFLYDHYHDIAAGFTAVAGVTAGIIALSFVIVLVKVRIPVNAANKRAEFDARYQALTYAVTQDSAKSVVLAEDIADYNADVRKGRNLMHSMLSCTTYTFWDEVPLIEYGGDADA